MHGRHLTIAMVALGLLVGGCLPSPADGPALEGTQWVLVTLEADPPLTETELTAEFSADQISGSTGCNHYAGTYSIDDSQISIGDVERTEIYCGDPEGVMDQEQAYFAALDSVARYRLAGERLELQDATGDVILAFETPPPEPETSQVTQPTRTPTPAKPTPLPVQSQPPPTFQAPAGFKEYEDGVTGISVYVPRSWAVTGVMPGQSATPQSYPEDKYIGGEVREPGDTKCDLTIRPPDVSVTNAIQALRSDSAATIVSEREVVLQSGEAGIRAEVESMGPSISLFTETEGRTVVLTCFGEFAPFDEIAGTVGAAE